MNRILAVAAAFGLVLITPVAASARTFVSFEDCANMAGFIAADDYVLSHPGAGGGYARALIALVEALRAGRPDLSPTDILNDCHFKNTTRIWSLAKSQATWPAAPEQPLFRCVDDYAGEMICN